MEMTNHTLGSLRPIEFRIMSESDELRLSGYTPTQIELDEPVQSEIWERTKLHKLPAQSSTPRRGRFVAIEGIDGSGKSSLAHELAGSLRRYGLQVLNSHEPGSKIEHDIRALFKSEDRPGPDEMTVMFTADRLMYMRDVIRPSLHAGIHVIADRHKLSTLVYQTASGATSELVRMAVDIPQPNPDLTIILDLSPKVARERMTGRTLDSYERDIEKQRVMRDAYLDHRSDFGRSVVIDASRNSTLVLLEANAIVLDLIREEYDNGHE